MTADHIDFIVPIALKEVMERLAPLYTLQTGATFDIAHVLNPEVPGLIAERDHWDIAITNPVYVGQIVAAGHSDRGTCHAFAHAPLALCAKGDHSDIAKTSEGLIQILTSAKSIALTDTGTSGDAFRTLLSDLGIWAEVSDRLLHLDGGGPMRAVLDGRATLAALPLTNIAPMLGISVVGICPSALCPAIEFALCLSRAAPESAHAFRDWLLDATLDATLADLGAMRRA